MKIKTILTVTIFVAAFGNISFSSNDQRKQITLPPKIYKPVTVPPTNVQATSQIAHIPDPSVAEIQRELQDIMHIRQSLQAMQQHEIIEIQRITEEAKLHQRLLDELSKGNASGGNAKKEGVKDQIDEAVRRQKIQLIEKEADKNRSYMEKLREKSAQSKNAPPITIDKNLETKSKISGVPSSPKDKSKQSDQNQKPKKAFWWWSPPQ